MKLKQKFIMILLLLLLSPIILWNGFDVYPGIKNSHHDFQGAAYMNNEICILCHTPHNAIASAPPLWNHELSTATYNLYSSPTIDAAIGQPTAQSKLCLSCHDGTVAIDNIGGNTGGTRFIYPFGYIGTDLSSHHPISFTYNSALAAADGQLADPSTEPSGLGGTIDDDLLSNGQMQCTSCHDVHISRNTQGCSGCHFGKPSLSIWKPNTNSALCLTCHKK
ncbi:Cytochrome c family protein [hydrothermal vent metagenome]|uniref:Cytochrome c family protein n=1 Tax=hydrothermal vent metagenome TaxID=652676 RepID=A0A3B1DH54_9ZZZZ